MGAASTTTTTTTNNTTAAVATTNANATTIKRSSKNAIIDASDKYPKEAPPTLFRLLWSVFSPKTHVGTTNIIYFVIAIFIYNLHYPHDTVRALYFSGAPVFAHLPWILGVVARNVALAGAVYSAWHYALYARTPSLGRDKVYPEQPPRSQHVRDAFWTLLGAAIGGCFEALLVYTWATSLRHEQQQEQQQHCSLLTLRTLGLFLLASAWSDVHFYLVHRVMHPWRLSTTTTGNGAAVFDPGRWLYIHVHAFHHRSYNPGPFSGLAMHPVEHIIYFSRSLWPLAVACHPVLGIFTNVRAILGPAPGHHGYADVLGSRFHALHHLHRECNYSTRGMFDKYFGTYRS